MKVKLNMKFRGACPHCEKCVGLVMVDALTGHYVCSEGCPYYEDYQYEISRRRQLLYEALRSREQLRIARAKAKDEAKAKAEEEELNQLFDSTPWSEPEWHMHEFRRQYAAGWRILTKCVNFRGRNVTMNKHLKDDKVIVVKDGVWPAEWLEAGHPVKAEPGHIW